jgi:hypothetical protein
MGSRVAVWVVAVVAGVSFLAMVKIMADMSDHMARMTGQVAELSADVKGMRASVDRMAEAVLQGSRQMQQVNPMQMVPGIAPGQPQR